MFEISVATCSECGQRSANEDSLRAGSAGSTQYAVVSDGAGGHARGADASRRVVDHIERALQSASSAFAGAALAEALVSAHVALQQEQLGAEGRQRMHATVVALWVDMRQARAVWSHVGDSRLYRLRYGVVDLVTVDDSVVQRMLESGILTLQQADDHPLRNQLLAALGMQDNLEPHTLAQAEPLDDGDAFLLCTDGWWGALTDTQLTGTLNNASTPRDWLVAMRELIIAQAAPGQDNFSAIAVWVSNPAGTAQWAADADATVAAPLAGG